MKFLSQEWFVEHRKLLELAFEKPTRSSVGLVEVYENCYGEEDKTIWIHYEQKDGVMTKCELGEGEDSIPEATYRCFGDYANYVLVCQGKLDPNKGIITGKFTLEGNLIKAMGMLGTYAKITKSKKVPGTEF